MKKNYLKFCQSLLISFLFLQNAQAIRILSGEFVAPYVFLDSDNGIDNQIVKKSFEAANVSVEFEKVPYIRVRMNYVSQHIDCASSTDESANLHGNYSNSYIDYEDAVYKLKSSNLPSVQKVSDLENYKVLAFQDARIYLGRDFRLMASVNKNYYEINDQKKQVEFLLNGKVDYIVGDIHVIEYYYNKIERNKIHHLNIDSEFEKYPVFEKLKYKIVCKDKENTEKFNEGFEKIQKNGVLQSILKSKDHAL